MDDPSGQQQQQGHIQQHLLKKLRGYGSLRSSFGCCTLQFGVIYWSLSSLVFGIGLLMFVALVQWTVRDAVHFTFEMQKGVVATIRLGKQPKTSFSLFSSSSSPSSSSSSSSSALPPPPSFYQQTELYLPSSSQLLSLLSGATTAATAAATAVGPGESSTLPLASISSASYFDDSSFHAAAASAANAADADAAAADASLPMGSLHSFIHTRTDEISNSTSPVSRDLFTQNSLFANRKATVKSNSSLSSVFPSSSLSTKGDSAVDTTELQSVIEGIVDKLDWWIKRVLYLYSFLCIIRGVVGILGVGLQDPGFIITLWYLTVLSFLIDAVICASFPIAICAKGIRLAWYLWVWLVWPLFYVPYIGWYTAELVFSYYRVLDMGGSGTELASAGDLEALLIPDKRHSLRVV